MKRTLIKTPDLSAFPKEAAEYLTDAEIFDSSCSPEARVFFIDKDGGYYLKTSDCGTLKKEAELTRFFNGKGLATEVLFYVQDEKDWLLTRKVEGEDCTFAKYLENPERLTDLLAEKLRELHETSGDGCPVKDRTAEYLRTVDENFAKGMFDPSYCCEEYRKMSAEEVYREIERNRNTLCSDTLIHGDYCLPNIVLNDWNFSAFIDLGNGGIADRHIDLYWAIWTLEFNLKTDKYASRFIDAYGRDKIEKEKLKLISAIEAFG